MAEITTGYLRSLADSLTERNQKQAASLIGKDATRINRAINRLYDQLPEDMKRETREIFVNPYVTSEEVELLSELPQMIINSRLPKLKQQTMLKELSDLYREYTEA
ncbi:MAG TPA: hypothetical protein VJZ27_06105 [Aggregatilineales bacterium]|nr:hypothetical protein [Aggregatilineales bacterium]